MIQYTCLNCGAIRTSHIVVRYCSKPLCRLAYNKYVREYKTAWQRQKRQKTKVQKQKKLQIILPKLTWYEQVVYNNAKREGKDPELAVESVRRIADHKQEFSGIEIGNQLTAYLRSRKRRVRSVWHRRKKNPPAVKI